MLELIHGMADVSEDRVLDVVPIELELLGEAPIAALRRPRDRLQRPHQPLLKRS